jgi:hypothetical protein
MIFNIGPIYQTLATINSPVKEEEAMSSKIKEQS